MEIINNSNRKFQYGDGFFETIIVKNRIINYWDSHFNRIQHACKTLKIDAEPDLKSKLETQIIAKCNASKTRVKIQFWRSGEGKYAPDKNELEFDIQVRENKTPFFSTKNKIGFCVSSKVIPSPFSSFKCFLLPYIIAGKEKLESSKDDLILLNDNDEIAECISSNIFWMKDGKLYTPSLNSGCLDGVMRKQIINQHKVIEGLFQKEELQKAGNIFCTNVTGITQFKKIGNQQLKLIDLENFFQDL